MALKDQLKRKTATVGVVGLGYVGLPLAVAFARSGFKVIGFDIQSKRVDAVNACRSYIVDVPDETLSAVVSGRQLEATTDVDRLGQADVLCICVPTPFTRSKDPDLSYVIRTTQDISRLLRRGQLIVLESTTYPGTTREVILPILESSGLKVEKDFFLAFSPERVDPGNRSFNFKTIPKVLGGIGPKSAALAFQLYSVISDRVVQVSSPEVAELAKLLENTFRNVNIALVNELAQLCEKMGISVWEVIDAAATKPFGFMPFYPGPGVGGHCVPKDPYYLEARARQHDFHTRFIELAASINEQMPSFTASRIIEEMSRRGQGIKDARILVLGVSFKKDVDDMRDSPSIKLMDILQQNGAALAYNDPRIGEINLDGKRLKSIKLSDRSLSSAECVIIATDHSTYDYRSIIDKSQLVFDTRGVTRSFGNTRHNIVRLGEKTAYPIPTRSHRE